MENKCKCGRVIPPEFKKCFKCAMRTLKPEENTYRSWEPVKKAEFEQFPVSQQSETYRKWEIDGVRKDSGAENWDSDWMEAYIYNRIDMALISKNEDQFVIWTNQLREFKEGIA
jgi:hypothetical protein